MASDTEKRPEDSGRSWGKVLLGVVAVLALVGVVIGVARLAPITYRYYTDADLIKESASTAATRDILWQPPEELAKLLDVRAGDSEPSLSADGVTLFFVRGKAGENAEIYSVIRRPSGWGDPAPLAEINSPYDDLGPEPSPDGKSLYFYSDRPGGSDGYDLWVSRRDTDGWQPPVNLGPQVNSEFNDYAPALSPNGSTIYFASNRPAANKSKPKTPLEWKRERGRPQRDYDLYVSVVTSTDVKVASPLTEINTRFNDTAPAVSSFGDFLYFSSDRPDGQGGFDLYRSRRLAGEYRPAQNLGPTVNTPGNELDPGLSLGGYALYFSSDRGRTAAPKDTLASYDLYYTTSREVFSQVEEFERPPIDWAAIWSKIGPNLIWAILLLVLTLALLSLIRDTKQRRLSLLARCMLASLAAHLMLLMLFNVWEVTASLAKEFHRGGRIQIALASPTSGSELANQIRGNLTSIDVPTPVSVESERRENPVDLPTEQPKASMEVARHEIATTETPEIQAVTQDMNVERQAEDAPPEQVQADASEPAPIETATPKDQERVATNEPTAAADRTPVETTATNRPPVAVTVAPNADRREELTPSESPESNTPSARERSSMAAASATADASPMPAPTGSVSAQAVSTIDAATTSDLPLPQAPIERQAEVREAEIQVPASTVAAPRKELATRMDDESIGQSATQLITPQQGVAQLTDATLADTSDVQASDSPVAPKATDTGEPGSNTSTLPTTDDLTLASPQSTEAVATAETVAEALEPVMERSQHASADHPEDDLDANTPTVVIAPSATNTPVGDRSVAVAEPLRTADATNVSASVEAVSVDADVASLPTQVAIDLPTLQQADQTEQQETAPQLVSQETTDTRAALEEQAMQAEATSQVALAPTETDQQSPATSTSLAEVSLSESSVARAETPHDSDSVEIPLLDLSSPVAVAIPTLEQSEALPAADEREDETPTMAIEMPRATLDSAADSLNESPPTQAALPPAELDHTNRMASASLADMTSGTNETDRTDPSYAGLLPGSETLDIPLAMSLDVSLPTDIVPPDDPYVQRQEQDRLALVKRMGGSRTTEQAVEDALRWLAAHQSPNGRWDADGFDQECGQCGGETDIVADRALTGLSLLAFLGAGHTHEEDGPYRDNIERAVLWLMTRQAPDGDLRGQETMYTQGIATIALSEAYGMTGDVKLEAPVKKAVRFIERARNPKDGGWRYDPGQAGDTSVLGWQVMAMKSANMNGVAVPAAAFQAARKWLGRVSHRRRPGLYSYQRGRDYTPSMTAEGMFVQQLLGQGRDTPGMKNAVSLIMDNLPNWEEDANTYYWYYATLAMYQHQGPQWKKWNKALTKELLDHQRKDEPALGSWNPDGEWAETGGRVYQTAICTLMLEVYYRYLPLYMLEQNADAIGSIVGKVIDVTSGEPLVGASIHLSLPDREPAVVTTNANGRYKLFVPEVPDFFALSASLEDFVPQSKNVDKAMLKGTTLTLDFELTPNNEQVVAVEASPEVHHLGDNRFEGSINSQFQKESEGAAFESSFTLTSSQVQPYVTTAQIVLLAKGVQRSHKIRINGRVLDKRLDDAPDDGSFGEFSATFDADLLVEGENTIEIIAKPSSSDIDDFEFINIQLLLTP